MKNKPKIFITLIVFVLLSAILVNQYSGLLALVAADNMYVESVCTFSAPTKAEATAKCRSAGYTPVDGDINEGNDADAVVIGYKTTTNKYEAITDMTVLEMNSGYETKNYSYIVEKQMEQAKKITTPLMLSLDEFSYNLARNSPAAIEARDLLNLMYIPEKGGAPLGDYLAGIDCSEDFLKKIICQANTGIMTAIVNSLANGVADFGGDNWAERVINTEIHEQLKAVNVDPQLDRDYESMAKDLRQPLHEFATLVDSAEAFVSAYGYNALNSGGGYSYDYELPDSLVENITECVSLEEKDKYAFYLMAYDLLNTYSFEDGTLLGDYIRSLGEASYTSLEDIRNVYPLAASLTEGQFGVMRLAGIPRMVLALTNTAENITEMQKYTADLRREISAFNSDGSGKLSVWVGTDPIPYTSEIALTYRANRELAASKEYSNLTQESQKDKNLNYLLTSFSIGSTVVDAAVTLATIVYSGTQIIKAGGIWAWATAETTGFWTMCFESATAAGTGVLATCLGYLGVILVIGTWIMTALTILVLLYMLVDWLVDKFTPEDDTLEYTTSDIPFYVYDYRDSQYLRYDVVKDQNGNPADVNAGEGRRFAALYTTKQSAAGEPIRVNPYGDTFKLVKENTLAPSGYSSVRYFGPGAAADMNSYSESRSAPSIYLSYFSGQIIEINKGEIGTPPLPMPADGAFDDITDPIYSEDPIDTTDPIDPVDTEDPIEPEDPAEPEDPGPDESIVIVPTAAQTEYISSLYVAAEKTESAAKDKLIKMGYIPIDKNLTGYYGEKGGIYTYIGYQTTTIPKEAVTDIRIVPQGISAGDTMMFGVSTYTRAGDDIPSTIPSIYFCKSDSAGTPIYADLQIVNKKTLAKEGFEPVNLFCGGDAYNMNATGDTDYYPVSLSHKGWNSSNNVYIYFHPSVTFTSGTEYIGGLAFFTGKKTTLLNGSEFTDYASDNGFKLFDKNFTGDYSIVLEIARHIGKGTAYSDKKIDDIATYLGYSTTYNPYRAIYAVRSYTALNDDVTALNEMLISGRTEITAANKQTQMLSNSYAACNVFYQFCGQMSKSDNKITGYFRGVLTSNAWNGINESSRYEILPEVAEYPTQETDDFENFSWKSSAPRLKNLYVSGNIPGMSPLRVGDIVLTGDLAGESEYNGRGMYSVQDVKTPNRSEAHNIGFSSANPLYLFVRGEKPHEKKYISAITVSTWDFDKAIGSDKGFKALDSDQQEEYRNKYNSMKDDMCIISAVQSCTDEIINKNLAVSYADSIQNDIDNDPAEASYIGISRTDNSLDAIRSIIKFKPANKSDASLTIKVEGCEYTRAGDDTVYDKDGAYYLYYSTSIGCAPNEPITSIDFSDIPIVKDAATALTATESDVQQRTHAGEVVREGRTGELKGYAGETNYIHSSFETTKTYLCDIYVGVGNTATDAMIDLLNMGCNAFLDIDMNKGANGKYIYVGYDRYYDKDTAAKSAVRDVICTVGHSAAPQITLNGVTYKRACDHYIYNGDTTKAVSLNEGTNGYSLYLYYTAAASGSARTPIMNIAAAEKDLVPENSDQFVWENVMTTSGRRAEMNDGVFATDDGHDRDARIYMFAHRADNSVKEGSGIVCGVTWGTMKYGKLVLK